MQPVILQQIVMNLSILTAVVLSLHSFFANLTAGRFGVEVRESTNELSNASYGKSKQATAAREAPSKPCPGSHIHSSHDLPLRAYKDDPGLRPGVANKSNAWAQHEEANDWEGSDRRSNGSQENIIKQTVTWQVSTHTAVSSASRGDHEELLQTLPPNGELREARARNFVT